jgi:ATP/maltotriose-dependent transcriptional regulator MalT
MSATLLRTKLYIPPLRPNLVPRPRLIEQLNQGLQLGHKLTLISAPAGFGKTTLISEIEWLHFHHKYMTYVTCSPEPKINTLIRGSISF